MRIAIVNDVWSADATTPEATLERFTTLTGWCEAIAATGLEVAVFQRFHSDAILSRAGIAYRFVSDCGAPRPSRRYAGSAALNDALLQFHPDIVHVNGLDFPVALRRLRSRLPGTCALVVQDHGGFDPHGLSWLRLSWLRYGLAAADALLVATPPQIASFRDSGVAPPAVLVRDVMEGSTTLRARSGRAHHRHPSVLWVGRLNQNKDPLTVAAGFARFVEQCPQATLTFVYQHGDLERELQAFVQRHEVLRKSVTLRGFVPHDQLEDLYAAADLFVLGSHHEGSGYAVVEALACGVPPVVTDIPPFRWLTDGGRLGALWTAGDAASCGGALERAASAPCRDQRQACCLRFADHFSWQAIGRRAAAIYEELSRT